ncbi:CAC1F-C domain-containing protein [Aphelenchoides bicaudatus]|nr:CAC1F-C domain-containing protein [Aphelenchoides bicaudatus]
MDPHVVEVARREMAEAYELDDRQLATAAYTLTDPTYYEHTGGMNPNEFSDINQYSQQSLLRPASTAATNSHHVPNNGGNRSGDANDDSVLITTL